MRLFLFSGFAALIFATAAQADGLMTGAEVQQLAPGHYHVFAPGVTIEVDLGLKGKISVVTSKGVTSRNSSATCSFECVHRKRIRARHRQAQ